MADLVADGGTTYTVTHDISNDNVTVSQSSTGTMIQGGFTNTVSGTLMMGRDAGSSGIYYLSAGSLAVNYSECLGCK